jgi:hypothetical protein
MSVPDRVDRARNAWSERHWSGVIHPVRAGAPRPGSAYGIRVFHGPAASRHARRDLDRYNRSRAHRVLTPDELEETERRRIPARVREVNRRMLEQLEARAAVVPRGEQMDLLGGEP